MDNHFLVKDTKISPFEIKGVMRYRPRYISPRIRFQQGLFTVHADPAKPLAIGKENGIKVNQIIIDKNYKSFLIWDLARFGIQKASLFSDLDGIAEYISWMFSTYDHKKAPP